MKGEMLDNYMDRRYIYTILPGNLPFKKADRVVVVGFILALKARFSGLGIFTK